MRPSPEQLSAFQRAIWSHYHRLGRTMLWRRTRDPYRILVSEIMLQQTQVDRVLPAYTAFIEKFPNFASLAHSPVADVLRTWQGLGYNRRAVWLKRLAEIVIAKHDGRLPQDTDALRRLPGIGPGTAGAIAAFAFQKPVAFIETNIRRVYIHFFFPKVAGVPDVRILPLITATVSKQNPREWYYALMDYGAMLGLKKGMANPNRRSKNYTVQSHFEGSNRQLRGRILAALLADPSHTLPLLAQQLNAPIAKIEAAHNALRKEGLIPYD